MKNTFVIECEHNLEPAQGGEPVEESIGRLIAASLRTADSFFNGKLAFTVRPVREQAGERRSEIGDRKEAKFRLRIASGTGAGFYVGPCNTTVLEAQAQLFTADQVLSFRDMQDGEGWKFEAEFVAP